MLKAFREILNSEAILERDDVKKYIILKETARESAIKKLYITNIPEEIIAFTLDYKSYPQLSQYLNKQNELGINKSCDMVVLWRGKDDSYKVLIFDLKSKKPSKNKTEIQLQNSRLFFDYLCSLVKEFYSIEKCDFEIKKVIGVTRKRNIPKRGVYSHTQSNKTTKEYATVLLTTTGKKNEESYIPLNKLMNAR